MNSTVKCFIIDDEPSAREVLKKLISKISFLTIVGEFGNAVDAIFQIRQSSPDVIFLDIEMPELNGLDFIKSFQNKARPQIIMTSGYKKYAIEGYDYEVIDYLHKPISFDRFARSIQKLLEQIPLSNAISSHENSNNNLSASVSYETSTNDTILIKVDKKLLRIPTKDILTVVSLGDYIKISQKSKVLITYMTMNKIENLLLSDRFIRISRFQIINKFIIEEIEGNQIIDSDGTKYMIGISYRDKVLHQLQAVFL